MIFIEQESSRRLNLIETIAVCLGAKKEAKSLKKEYYANVKKYGTEYNSNPYTRYNLDQSNLVCPLFIKRINKELHRLHFRKEVELKGCSSVAFYDPRERAANKYSFKIEREAKRYYKKYLKNTTQVERKMLEYQYCNSQFKTDLYDLAEKDNKKLVFLNDYEFTMERIEKKN